MAAICTSGDSKELTFLQRWISLLIAITVIILIAVILIARFSRLPRMK